MADSKRDYGDNLDAEIIIVDGPGDTTVRPTRPSILRWREEDRKRRQAKPPEQAEPEQPEGK